MTVNAGPSPNRRTDLELVAGSSAHYDDPAYYAHAYQKRADDIAFYVHRALCSPGPVLEYGCGNGRITLPIARTGKTITGVDLSAPMIRDLRGRIRHEPKSVQKHIQALRGDMRAIRLDRRFPLILCPFNTFLHLYTRPDIERFLARVREHLAPRSGRFVFDVSIPEPLELCRTPDRAYFTPRFRYPASNPAKTPQNPAPKTKKTGPLVRYSERFDYDKLRQILFVAMEFEPLDEGAGESWMTPLTHRQFYPQELEALLHYNGFSMTEMWGDFDRSPPSQDSGELIIECKARSQKKRA